MIFVTQKKSVYVDSVAGSDANDGLTATTPKATCAAGMTVLASSGRKTIRLKCGSFFREQINLPAGKRLKNYGSGARPILDPRENITGSWTLYGAAYTYQQTVSHALGVPSTHRVWEDGVRLIRVASLAAVETTEGSFYAAAPSGTTGVLYIHPTDNGNPNSNGKTYSYSYRTYGVDIGDGCLVDGIKTGWQGGNDGSIRALARNCIIRNCDAIDGTKHNLLIADGTCEDVLCDDAEPLGGVGSQSLFVSYNNFSSGTYPNVVYRRCTARMAVQQSLASIGWLSHGNRKYTKITNEDCIASGIGYAAFGIDGCSVHIVSRCTVFSSKMFLLSGTGTDVYIYRGRFVADSLSTSQRYFLNGKHAKCFIRQSECLSYAATIKCGSASPSLLDIRYSTFSPISGSPEMVLTFRTNDDTTLRNNIIWSSGRYLTNDGNTVPGDLKCDTNLVYSTSMPTGSSAYFVMGSAGAYKTWQGWRDLGYDIHSVLADPLRITTANANSFSVFNSSGPVFTSGFPVGVQPTDDAETLALLASVGYTP